MDLLKVLLLVVSAIAILIPIAGGYGSYCQQPGTGCFFGECDRKSQTCKCQKGYTSSDCQLPEYVVLKDPTKCGVGGCHKNGYCYGFRKYTGCYCNFGFFGQQCQYRNLTVTCDPGGMNIEVMTPGQKIVEMHDHKECGFNFTSTPVDLRQNLYKYEKFIPIDGSECPHYKKKKIDKLNTRYELDIDIREKPLGYSPLDYSKRVICNYKSRSYSDVQGSAEENKIFSIDLLDQNHEKIWNNQVAPGDEMSLSFYPHENRRKKRKSGAPEEIIGIYRLSMIDATTSKKMFDIIDNYCATYTGKELLVNPLPVVNGYTPPNGPQTKATFVTFRPMQQVLQVAFDYVLQICEGVCPEPDCTGTPLKKSHTGIRVDFN